MISDVIFEAAVEIREYLKQWPKVYAPHAQEIHEMLNVMEKVRQQLDQVPAEGQGGTNGDH